MSLRDDAIAALTQQRDLLKAAVERLCTASTVFGNAFDVDWEDGLITGEMSGQFVDAERDVENAVNAARDLLLRLADESLSRVDMREGA